MQSVICRNPEDCRRVARCQSIPKNPLTILQSMCNPFNLGNSICNRLIQGQFHRTSQFRDNRELQPRLLVIPPGTTAQLAHDPGMPGTINLNCIWIAILKGNAIQLRELCGSPWRDCTTSEGVGQHSCNPVIVLQSTPLQEIQRQSVDSGAIPRNLVISRQSRIALRLQFTSTPQP